jgi:hypothetical protein
MWFGIMMRASTSTSGKRIGMSFHNIAANRPAAFKCIVSSATSPSTQARSCVQIVTKYAPACA